MRTRLFRILAIASKSAAQIANPSDLLGPRKQTTIDAERRGIVIDVFGLVGVKAVVVGDDDLPRDRGLRVVVAQHGAFDLARIRDGGLDDGLAVELKRQLHRRRQGLERRGP